MAPVTGMLRKRLFIDIGAALGLGTLGGYWYWYGSAVPSMKRRDAYYAKLEAEKA